MSERNVDVVREILDAWGRGDFRASVEHFDPYAVLVLAPEFPDAGAHFGIDGIRAYTRRLLSAWERYSISAEDVAGAGDSVIARVHQEAVGAHSGIATELRYFMVWSFRAGKVIRLECVREHADALEATGLSLG